MRQLRPNVYAVGAIDFVSTTEGWIAGERDGRPAILHTINGGTTWTEQTTGTGDGQKTIFGGNR